MRNSYKAERYTGPGGVMTCIVVQETNGKRTCATRRIYQHAEASELCLELAKALGLKVALPREEP